MLAYGHWFDESSGCPFKRNVTSELVVVVVVVEVIVVINYNHWWKRDCHFTYTLNLNPKSVKLKSESGYLHFLGQKVQLLHKWNFLTAEFQRHFSSSKIRGGSVTSPRCLLTLWKVESWFDNKNSGHRNPFWAAGYSTAMVVSYVQEMFITCSLMFDTILKR